MQTIISNLDSHRVPHTFFFFLLWEVFLKFFFINTITLKLTLRIKEFTIQCLESIFILTFIIAILQGR